MIRELDVVALACDLPEYGLEAGDLGTIVLLHNDSGYEVEFMTFGGDTVAIITLDKNQVRPVRRHEIHHSRLLETKL